MKQRCSRGPWEPMSSSPTPLPLPIQPCTPSPYLGVPTAVRTWAGVAGGALPRCCMRKGLGVATSLSSCAASPPPTQPSSRRRASPCPCTPSPSGEGCDCDAHASNFLGSVCKQPYAQARALIQSEVGRRTGN